MTRRVIVTLIMLGLLAYASGASVSLARYSDSATTAGDLRVGTWYFLHHTPSPPIRDTPARTNLPMDAVAPVQTTLFNYDRNFDEIPGRSLAPTDPSPTTNRPQEMVNWRTPAAAAATPLSGMAELRVWSAVGDFLLGQPGSLVAHLRDYDPVSGRHIEIATTVLTQADWQRGHSGWVETRVDVPLPDYTLPAGHSIELKVQAGLGAAAPMHVAYDTTVHPAVLSIRP